MSGDYLQEGDPDWGWEFLVEDFVFARLKEARAEAERPGAPNRPESLHLVQALWVITARHSAYVDKDGRSLARCFTCSLGHGFPCTTMRVLASIWKTHEDYQPHWEATGDFLEDVVRLGGFRRAYIAGRDKTQGEADGTDKD